MGGVIIRKSGLLHCCTYYTRTIFFFFRSTCLQLVNGKGRQSRPSSLNILVYGAGHGLCARQHSQLSRMRHSYFQQPGSCVLRRPGSCALRHVRIHPFYRPRPGSCVLRLTTLVNGPQLRRTDDSVCEGRTA